MFSRTSLEQLITAASLQWYQAGVKLFLPWAVSISWMIYCGNQCKLVLLNYVIVQNNLNGYIGKTLNNIDIFSYSPLKINKLFWLNYEVEVQQRLVVEMNSNFRKKDCLLKDVLMLKINLKKTALCLLPEAERW